MLQGTDMWKGTLGVVFLYYGIMCWIMFYSFVSLWKKMFLKNEQIMFLRKPSVIISQKYCIFSPVKIVNSLITAKLFSITNFHSTGSTTRSHVSLVCGSCTTTVGNNIARTKPPSTCSGRMRPSSAVVTSPTGTGKSTAGRHHKHWDGTRSSKSNLFFSIGKRSNNLESAHLSLTLFLLRFRNQIQHPNSTYPPDPCSQ